MCSDLRLSDDLMSRYLLGELSEAEQDWVEEQYFEDNASFERLLRVEGELIDSYVRGELSEHERGKFETYFLTSPHQREKVEFARTLFRATAEKGSAYPIDAKAVQSHAIPWWLTLRSSMASVSSSIRYMAGALAMVLILVIGLMWVQNARLENQLNTVRSEMLRLKEQDLKNQAEKERSHLERSRDASGRAPGSLQNLAPFTLSFVLTPGLVRGIDEPRRLVVPPNIGIIQLQLEVEQASGYRSFRAVLRSEDGDELWSQSRLQPAPINTGGFVVLSLPATFLSNGSYLINLFGRGSAERVEEVADYHFSVMRE